MERKTKQELLEDGWVNDRTFPVHNTDENGIPHRSLGMTPAYTAWKHMKERCTSEKFKEKYPTYIDATASSEFKSFTSFHEWWFKQAGYGLPNVQLDKDLLMKGNKIYSAETCLLIPDFVNKFLTKRDATRGDCVIGVCKYGEYKNGDVRYRAQISEYDFVADKTIRKYLGYFRKELDAFNVYKSAKEAIAKKYAAYLKGKVDDRVIDALLNFTVDISD